MTTFSARETLRFLIGAGAFVTLFAGIGTATIGGGVAALVAVGPPSSIDQAAIAAAPGLFGAGLAGIVVGSAVLVAGLLTMGREMVATGVRVGLDRSAALDRPAVSRPAPSAASTPERSDDEDSPDRPADWTEDNAVERSRAPGSGEDDPEDEWVFKADDDSPSEADRPA